MRAVITVIGKDMVGILARVSSICAENNVNVVEVTQSILQDLFAMIMMVDISKCSIPFQDLVDALTAIGEGMGLTIHVMHEDIFNSMHRPAPDSPPQGDISSANKMFCAKIAVNCENWKQCLTLRCF